MFMDRSSKDEQKVIKKGKNRMLKGQQYFIGRRSSDTERLSQYY